jgi:hypothetical protein
VHFDLATFATGGIGALVLSAAARALPEPKPNGSQFYLWAYSFAHILLANFDKVNPGGWKAQ